MDKIVFITASSSGLGLQLAIDLSQKGYIVIINGRNENKLEYAKSKLHNPMLHYIFCYDLMSESLINQMNNFFQTIKLIPDIIIHCLGGRLDNDIHPINLDLLTTSLKLNLYSAISINNYFIPIFQKFEKINKIIHISSSASITGNASPSYSISKGALNIYIKNSARYYALDNISFCAIIPNIIMHTDSDWEKKRINNQKQFEQRINQMPLKKFSTPNDLSPYICSLCDIDNMYVTGSLIDLQGGV